MVLSRFAALAAAAAFTLLVGQITDKTTGQPLRGVHVRIGSARAVTDARGTFRMRVPPGRWTIAFSSDDVPPQQQRIAVAGARQTVHIQGCSTTLDYTCGSGGGGGR